MRIRAIEIQNFRLFPWDKTFTLDNINIPNGSAGSGLTVFVGENASGKTSLLDAIALPLLTYKAESFKLSDFHNPKHKVYIRILSDSNFEFDGTMPKAKYKAKGFQFEAGLRSRGNKSYLSSLVVQDQKFIRADGEDKPDDTSPDLRVNVNNPFKGTRFNENDILFLDRNRTFQTRSGTYNDTRFDRLMEDFDYQYLRSLEQAPNLNDILDKEIKKHVEHPFLEKAIQRFKELSNNTITLDFIDNWSPFKSGFFSERMKNNLQIRLNLLGSGYEMIFCLLYSFYLSQQSGKQLISLIDEPELHMHPALQFEFVKFLLEMSKDSQVIITTHSPLLVKQLFLNVNVRVFILKREDENLKLLPVDRRILPYVSANEINYLAFDLPTEELHNELYGYLQEKCQKYYENDLDDYLVSNGIKRTKKWRREKDGQLMGIEYDVTLQTFIRNKIHHPENKTMQNSLYTHEELKHSIDEIIKLLS